MPQREKQEEQLLFMELGPHCILSAFPGSQGLASLSAPAGAFARPAVQSAGAGSPQSSRETHPRQQLGTCEPRATGPCPRRLVPQFTVCLLPHGMAL